MKLSRLNLECFMCVEVLASLKKVVLQYGAIAGDHSVYGESCVADSDSK